MGNQHKAHTPEAGFDRVGRKCFEVRHHISGIAIQLSCYRGKEILQAPASHDGIESKDNS